MVYKFYSLYLLVECLIDGLMRVSEQRFKTILESGVGSFERGWKTGGVVIPK